MTADLPPGFELVPAWLPAAEAAATFEALLAELPWQQTQVRIYGRDVATPRLTAWLGNVDATYTYSGRLHEPAPWHPLVLDLARRLELRTGAAFNSCLGNLYRDGRDSVAWHADDEAELGAEPVIASVSLGAARTFSVKARRRPGRWSIALAAGDLLIMRGRSQADYLHAIAKTARPVGRRLNLTFRVIGAGR